MVREAGFGHFNAALIAGLLSGFFEVQNNVAAYRIAQCV
jgi:hypothetical protein